MNWAIARCRRATCPFITTKRDPASFAAVSKSRPPSPAPTSTWSLGSKSNVRGSPQRRSSTLSSGRLPSGTLSCGTLGICQTNSCSLACTAVFSASICFSFSASSAPCRISVAACASSFFALAWPTCLASALRWDCSCSVAVWMLFLAAQLCQLLADLSFHATIAGAVPLDLRHSLGKVILARRKRLRLIVRVAVALAVAQVLHQAGGSVADVQRHRPRAVLGNEAARRIISLVDRVRLCRHREINHRFGQRQLAFGTAEALVSLAGVERDAQRARVRKADVFHRH